MNKLKIILSTCKNTVCQFYTHTISTIMLVTMYLLVLSCSGKTDDNKNEIPLKFNTTFYLEINDGENKKIYRGTSSSSDASRYIEYSNEKLTIISFNTFGDRHDEVKGISGMILLDDNKNLHPFGEMHTANEFKTGMSITTNDKYLQSRYSGNQQLYEIEYYTRKDKKSRGRLAFKYVFDNVTFEDIITNLKYKISGHIASVAIE